MQCIGQTIKLFSDLSWEYLPAMGYCWRRAWDVKHKQVKS